MPKEQKSWKKELARDFLALGSWVFYILVIARAAIEPYRPFVDQVIISGLIILILKLAYKNFNDYIARGIALIYFTSLFYQDMLFTAFAALVGIGLLISAYALGSPKKNIVLGLAVGIIATFSGNYIPNIYLN